LSLAAANGNVEMVRYLVACGVEINASKGDSYYYTESPLASAIAFNNYEIASYLLSVGAQFYIPEDGWRMGTGTGPISDLDCAVVSGNIEMLSLLGDYAYPFNKDNGFFASMKAIGTGNLHFLSYFLGEGFDVNYQSDIGTLLSEACLNENFEAVKILDEYGADMNDAYAFETACEKGTFEIVRYMTERGMGAGSLVSGLGQAVFYGRFDIIKFLVEEGTEIDADCLNSAAVASYRILQYLIDHGANIDGCDAGGYTALMAAVWGQKTKCIKILLDAGADTSLKNNDGQTAYDIAKETNNKAIIKLLEKKQK
jgi:ankyrin repeat protein